MPFLSILAFDRQSFIEEEWIRLVLDAKPDSFASLKQLRFRTTHIGFRLLEPNLEHLEQLWVGLRAGTPPLQFRAPCNMPHLEVLTLLLDSNGIIDGKELIGLARCCPQLIYIIIGWESDYARCYEVSDSIIEAFVQLLPNLKLFNLYADSSSLTERSLLHFGRHCKDLEQLTIPGMLDFFELAKTGEPSLFPELRRLTVAADPNEQNPLHYMIQTNSYEEFSALRYRILLTMPSLQEINASSILIEWVHKGAHTRSNLESQMMHVIRERNTWFDGDSE